MRPLLALLALTLAGCATSGDTLTLRRLPAWPVAVEHAVRIPAATVAHEARLLVPGAAVSFVDSVYTPVPHAWLESYLAWSWHAAKAAGLTYTPESWDCDNFTALFSQLASRAAAKAGITAAPLVADLTVQLTPATRHALNGVYTERGVFIVEPQPDAGPFRLVPLKDYAPRILAIELGGTNPW